MSVTREQREAWRHLRDTYGEASVTCVAVGELTALLDALDAAEARADREADHCVEGSLWQHRATSAESALRAMEIERNALRERLGRVAEVRTRLDLIPNRTEANVVDDIAEALDLALAGPEPRDEGGDLSDYAEDYIAQGHEGDEGGAEA